MSPLSSLFVILSLHIRSILSNVDCISIQSDLSPPVDGAKASVSCSAEYPTLVSCGFSMEDATDRFFDGSYINNTDNTCNANNRPGRNQNVYAHARCCDFQSTDVNCNASSAISGDNVDINIECDDTATQLGCSAYTTDDAGIDGTYPGVTRPGDIQFYDTYSYPSSLNCTATQSANIITAFISCCYSPTFKLECLTRYGSSSTTVSTVTCPDGYFMSGCSGWSPNPNANAVYIDDNDICNARQADQQSIIPTFSVATCCKIETAAPTTDPTLYPTMDPTTDPTMEPIFEPSGDDDDGEEDDLLFGLDKTVAIIILAVIIGVILVICIIGIICCKRKNNDPWAEEVKKSKPKKTNKQEMAQMNQPGTTDPGQPAAKFNV